MIESYIAGILGEALVKSISAGTLLSDTETMARFKALYPIDAHGVGKSQPEGYWYKEVGYFYRVQGFAESGTLDGDDRASTLVVTCGFPRKTLGCRVAWRLAIAAVRALLAPKTREGRWFQLAATSDDGAYGFTFTSHVGYHPRELHDDETVYQVSRWHPPPK